MSNANESAYPVRTREHESAGLTKREAAAIEMAKIIGPPTDYVGVDQTRKSYEEWVAKSYRMADSLLGDAP